MVVFFCCSHIDGTRLPDDDDYYLIHDFYITEKQNTANPSRFITASKWYRAPLAKRNIHVDLVSK